MGQVGMSDLLNKQKPLDWTTSMKLSTILKFHNSDISRALTLHVGFRKRGYM